MGLLVLNPGLSTTFQDAGRPGFRDRGVPPAGAFDLGSHQLANALLDNPRESATLELTLDGGRYEATTTMELSLAGATMPVRIEGHARQVTDLLPPCSFLLRAGDRMTIGTARGQVRAYLAANGGWLYPIVLGSRSSEIPIRSGIEIEALSVIEDQIAGFWNMIRRLHRFDTPADQGVVRVMAGPDAGHDLDASPLLNESFRVSARSDRMGLRLEGPVIERPSDPDRLSEPVVPGAVQVAGGQLLVLGVACGTMGGYPHLAQVVSADLDRLAQARPGSLVCFKEVDPEEAMRLDRAHRLERSGFLSCVEVRVRDHRRLLGNRG
jgi:biotin-dependent carboxylase-like uncharacterized protein